MASDGGREVLHSKSVVFFLVFHALQLCAGQNVSPPSFVDVPTSPVPVSEDASVGDTVFTCNATDPDTGTASLTYSIVAGNDDSKFVIDDPTTCAVTLAQSLDYETTSSYSLTLEVSDNDANPAALTAQHVFSVEVQDVNEFTPAFVNVPSSPLSLPEDTASGASVFTCSVQDGDSASQPSGQHVFTIIGGNTDGAFSLDNDTCLLTLIGQLDFETTPRYDIVIRASDLDPAASRSADLTVGIDVTDVNEKPTFKNLPAALNISEDTPVSTTIFTCSAKDPDDSSLPRGQLVYSIRSGNDAGKFSIGGTTGEVTLVDSLDFEDTAEYVLEIRAMDQDPVSKMSVLRTLTLHVTDVNEHTPAFANVPTSPANVEETASVGSPVFTCSATDDDSPTEPSGTLIYAITAGNDGGEFAVDTTTCLVTVDSNLDFETKNTYTLTLQACDLGDVPKCAQQDYTVDIVDMNEPPVFGNPVSSPSVRENLPAGTSVFECSVADDDNPSLPRGQHTFSIKSGNEDGAFTLVSPCRLETTQPLDIEQQFKYNIEIEVTDLDPVNPLKATHVFKVKVDDENDNTPYFTDIPPMPIVVPEDTAVGIPFWNCSGGDDDVEFELSGQVAFSLTAGNDENFFEVNLDNCSLSLLKSLDYEKKTLNFNLTIQISDLDPVAPRSVEQMFQFCVQNVNDNEPTWVTTLEKKYTIIENSPLNVLIGQCSATDADPEHDHSGLVRYMVKSGNKANLFYLDPYTCELWINGLLDYEDDKSHTLKIQAYDLDPVNPLISSTMKVKIAIEDENDMGPQCVAGLITVEVSEATPAKTIVTTLNCSDVDVGASGALRYSALSTSDVMKVAKMTGEVTALRTVDWDTEPRVYDLKIEVKDNGTPANSATATVRFVFVDADDIAPVWEAAAPYSVDVAENAARGSSILSVNATDGDQPDTSASTIVFGFESQPTPDWFVINKYTGEIFTKSPLDADTQSSVTVQVYAHSSDRFDARVLTDVTVNIDDVNDRKPVFQQKLYRASVQENSVVGTAVLTVSAVDPDSGLDGQVQYSVEDGFFDIDAISGQVTVKGNLDFETAQLHRLKVTASDLGTPQMTSQLDVIITVLPENEFTPVFVGSTVVSIPEDTVPGTPIFQLSATESDIGLDGEVKFSALSSASQQLFIVNENGQIFLAGSLDFDTVSSYSLVVSASDRSATEQKTSTTTLQIVVTDVNNLAPVCDSVPMAVSVYPWVNGGVVTTVNCLPDADTVNGQLSYSIVSGDPAGVFQIDSVTGDITVIAQPSLSSYELLVEVSDGGSPPQTTSVPVTILAEPSMSITNLPANVSFAEDTAYGTVLFTVETCCSWTATELQIVSGNDDNIFHLHHLTGDVILLRHLDREVALLHQLTITATDDRGQSSTSTLNIYVLDINDNSPIFTPVVTSVMIGEMQPTGSVFTQVTATDMDEGSNADLTYSLQDTFGSKFSVDQNGNLRVEAALDFESQQSYSLVVIATDGGSTALSGSATVQVELINADEYSPQFITGSGTVTLPEDSPLGVAVLVVSANDQDISDVVSYDIMSGNNDSTFHIRSDTGQVMLLKTLDRESADVYMLTIRASNNLGDTATVVIQIQIGDVDDNDPVFSSSVYEFDVPHNTLADVTVGHVTVSDADVGTNADFALSIISGNVGGYFTLDGTAVKTTTTVSYDGIKEFNLVVKAEGTGGETSPQRHSVAAVKINVLPDSATPKFNITTDTITIPEDTPVDLLVYDFDATQLGASEGDTGTLNYVLRSGNTDNHFTLDDKTGRLYLARPLDHESHTSFTLLVDAENKNNAAAKDSFTLTVDIVNINDNTPRPASAVFQFTVSEEDVSGAFVGQVIFTDADDGVEGDVTLTMTGCDDFAINTGNGDIMVSGVLDYSSVSLYNCLVSAVDGGSPPRTGVASVIISVLDTNNHAPDFLGAPYTVQLNENTPSGVTVATVRASDSDAGSNADVTYSVTSGDPTSVFSLDPAKGTLHLVSAVDVKAASQYVLEVTARDGGVPQQSAVTTVTVNVVDVNDHAPVFSAHPANIAVDRTAAVSHMLATFTATDDDIGPNAQITFALTAGNTHGLFTIDSNTGSLTTAASLLEADDTYTLTVKARDYGVPMQTATTTVSVSVSPPKTTSDTSVMMLNFTAREDAAVDSVVGTIDPYPSASAVGYSILSGNFDGSFQVVKQADDTAELRVAKQLDHETFPLFQLLVEIDTGTPLPIQKLVQVEVIDINDNPPEFTDSSLVLFVPEHSPVGHSVYTLTVEDADESTTNGQIVFSVLPADNPLLDVTVDGDLVLKASPDFETLQQLDVVVEAHDSGVPQMTSSMSVTLHIVDVEETQEVTVPSGSTSYISTEIPYNVQEGQLVYQLKVSDFHGLTATASDTVTFLALDTNSAFSVDGITGAVKVTAPSKLSVGTAYFQWVVCKVTDAGGSVSSDLAMLRIDTFDKYRHLVAVQVATDTTDLEANRATLLSSLQSKFPSPERVGIFTVIAHGSTARRRLLAAQSLALMYVVQDQTVDELGNVVMDKQFLTQQEILQVLQLSSDGTPVPGVATPSVPVELVMPYQTGEEDTGDNFWESTPGIIVIVVLCLIVVLIIVFIIACLLYRAKKRREWQPHRLQEGEKSRTQIFTTPRPGFLLPYSGRRGSDVSATSTTSLLDDDSGMGDSVHTARKSQSPSGSSASNSSYRTDRGDEIRLSPKYLTTSRKSRSSSACSSADSGTGSTVSHDKKQTRYTWNKEKHAEKWNCPNPKPPVSWLPHLPDSRRGSTDSQWDTPYTPRYGRRSSSLDRTVNSPSSLDGSSKRRGSADLWGSDNFSDDSRRRSSGLTGWSTTRRDSSPDNEKPPWLHSNPKAKPSFHRTLNPRLTSSFESLPVATSGPKGAGVTASWLRTTEDNPDSLDKMRLKDATPGHEVTWRPRRNSPPQIYNEKLQWNAVSAIDIPKVASRREDIMARNPVFADWAKSLARRKKRTDIASRKMATEGKKTEHEAEKKKEEEEEKKAVDSEDILRSFTAKRPQYNAPTYSWF